MRLLKDSAWVSGSLAISRGLSFAMVVVIARLLPISEFATYIVGVSAVVLIVPLADAGMWPLVARMAARRPSERSFVLTAAADRARAGAWSVAVVLAVAGWQLGLWPSGALWLFVLLGAMAEAELDTMKGELIGRLRYALAALLVLAPAALGLLGAFALPLVGLTATSGLLVFAGSRALPAIALHVRVPIRRQTASLSLKEGLPFAATRVLTTAYVTSDVLLLSLFGLPVIWIAVYGVTYRLVTALQLLPASIAIALFPRVAAGTRQEGVESTRAAAGLSLAMAGVAIALLFLDLPLIFSVFGDGYTERVEIMRPLFLVLLPIGLSMVCISGLQGRGHEREVLRVVAVIAIVNLAGNLVLIPVLGVRGALLATSVAEWSAAIGAMFLAIQYCDLRRSDLRTLMGGFAISALGFFPGVPAPALSVGIVVWIASIWLFNDLDLRRTGTTLRSGLLQSWGRFGRRRASPETEPVGTSGDGERPLT